MNTGHPTTPIERDPSRLEDALPWYLNGTLGEEDRQWVESQLAGSEEALAFDREIEAELQARAREIPADIGWSSLLARVRADGAPARAVPEAEPETFGRRVSRFFAQWLSPRVGMAMAVLIAVQTVGIGVLVNDRAGHETVTYRSGGQVAPVAVIRALFPEELTERRMREALSDAGLTIVDGPTPLGEYFLRGPEAELESLARRLEAQGVLASWSLDHKPMIR